VILYILLILFIIQKRNQIRSLQSVLASLCHSSNIQLSARLQTIDNQLAGLSLTDSRVFYSPTLTQSFDHIEELTSSGQLQSLHQSFTNLQTLVATSQKLIQQLQTQLTIRSESDPVSPYPQQMLQWLKNLHYSLSQKNESIQMIEKQLDFLQQQCQNVAFQRKQLELLSANFHPSSKTTLLLEQASELQDQIHNQRSLVLRMISDVDSIGNDGILVRLAVHQNASENPRGTVLKSVNSVIRSATDAMTELTLLCTNLDHINNELETEQQDSEHFAEQKRLIDNVKMVDRTYSSVSKTIISSLNDCQTLLNALQKAMVDVQQYVSNVASTRPNSAEEQTQRHIDGWECNTCGIVNDNSKMVCEACFQRRICYVS
jgi:hypothetical protein